MSVHLVGGGTSPDYAVDLYSVFLAEATARAQLAGGGLPRIGLVVVDEVPSGGDRYIAALESVAPCEVVLNFVIEGDELSSVALDGIHGLFVAGGLTPAYWAAIRALSGEIRLLVADGLPYLGFSAGAMIAAQTAILGGWRIDGIPVCAEETGEDLDEVTVIEGLALVDLAIDVHAAQWGTLSRLVAATEAGLVEGGVAIDESTVLVIGDGTVDVRGRGNVWRVTDSDDAVMVSTIS